MTDLKWNIAKKKMITHDDSIWNFLTYPYASLQKLCAISLLFVNAKKKSRYIRYFLNQIKNV